MKGVRAMKFEHEKYDKKVKISGGNNISIGSKTEHTICIAALSEDEFLIKNSNYIEKKSASSELSINGYLVEEPATFFSEHDFIGINDILMYYSEGCLYFCNKIKLDTSLQVENVRESNNHLEYPQFYRSVRQLYKISDNSIEVLQPKSPTEEDNQGFLATVLPAVMSMGMMLMMRLSTGSNKIFLLIFGALMLLSVGITISNFIKQKKKQEAKKENRLERYGDYIEKTENKIIKAREKEKRLLNQKYPSIIELIKNVEDFDARLFERKPSDDDFLVYSIGVGRHSAASQVSFKTQEYVELEDPLMDIPEQLHDKYEFIENMPVVISLKKANAVSFVGVRNKLFQMLKNMILQISIAHYYDDVKMCLFMEKEDVSYLSWVRWLQNFDDGMSDMRYIAYNDDNANKLLERLYTILSKRSNQQTSGRSHYVVFVYRTEKFYAHPIINYIKKAGELGFTFILFEEYPEYVNPDCTSRIFLNENDNAGYIQNATAGEDVLHFEYTHVSSSKAEYVAKRLSPIYVEETSLESNLVKNISLYELLKITSASQLNFKSRWENSRIYESMAAPLGLKSGDEMVCLDLHERFHGPHGLVAGTTGSGKSEILQSYILSMSTLFHPYEVSFIIIDFKGGGMVNQFKNLPHLNGAITNIDGKQIDRSLKSIKAELIKRQRLFAEMEVNHIDDYIKKFKCKEAKVPLPHLILIVDEFAELKSEQPEFMKELISAARIGRSLGVHLILATQKPAGVVNEQIWSNSNFKICLKVQNASDSNEVLKSPLAAEIREPGRAYLQVGNNEIFELFQSGYSGAKVSDGADDVPPYKINMVSLDGKRMPIYEKKKSEGDSDITQLEELVLAISKYCRDANIKPMENICLPPLKEHILCDYSSIELDKNIISVPIGIFDDPDNHYQGINTINLVEDNVCIVGSAGTGKTNMLLNIIRGVSELYSPEEVNIFVLDFASLILASVNKLCYISGVITSRDDELLVTFFNNIKEEIDSRKEKLSEQGYGSFYNYRQAGRKELPLIVIMIDNAVAFKEMFPEWLDFFITLCRDGLSVGISVIYTAAQAGALGYRANAYFSKNIALNCNDRNVYSSLFERNKLYPDECSGRYITNINKSVYEAQGFVPFEYDKYKNTIDAINEFVETTNGKHQSVSVSKLKSMPESITEEYLSEIHYSSTTDNVFIGIEHITLAVHQLNLMQKSVLGILNGNDNEEVGYIKYVLESYLDNDLCNVYIIDGMSKVLKQFAGKNNVHYTNDIKELGTLISELYTNLQSRCEAMSAEEENAYNNRDILVINTAEAYDVITREQLTSIKFTKICNQFKSLGVFVILADLPNINLSFSGPAAIRGIKDSMEIAIFRDMKEQKIIDIPARLAVSKKKRAANDIFYVHSSEISRVRVPFKE